MSAGIQLPGPGPIVFLLILLLLLPLAAIRSARLFRPRAGGAMPALPSRESIWARASMTQAILLALAWYTGAGFGYRLFATPPLDARALGAAVAALLAAFALRAILRRSRSEAERRSLAVMRLAPRTRREWVLWAVTVALASVAEEAAYRGVGMAILTWALQDARLAALLLAAAFAAAHAVQGLKSALMVFVLALVLHGLVALTGTLLLAMAVHALYDLVAGIAVARDAARFRAAAPA